MFKPGLEGFIERVNPQALHSIQDGDYSAESTWERGSDETISIGHRVTMDERTSDTEEQAMHDHLTDDQIAAGLKLAGEARGAFLTIRHDGISEHDAAYIAHAANHHESAIRELLELRDAIREHHDQKADDRCIEDDDRLYAAAGLPLCDRRVGSKDEMLANCRRFVEQRCEEGGPWKSYVELEAENAALRERLAKAGDEEGRIGATIREG